MTISALLNAIVDALQAASTTHLAEAKVFLGDQAAIRATKSVTIMWLGGSEEPHGIGDEFDNVHSVNVDLRMPARDSSAAVTEAAWYTDFLEFYEEVMTVLTTVANRTIEATDLTKATKLEVESWQPGWYQEGDQEMLGCQIGLRYTVPQD